MITITGLQNNRKDFNRISTAQSIFDEVSYFSDDELDEKIDKMRVDFMRLIDEASELMYKREKTVHNHLRVAAKSK